MTTPAAIADTQIAPPARVWFDPESKVQITDQQLVEWITTKTDSDKKNGKETKLIVGTDSHIAGLNFRFITVVCLYTVGSGGYFYYTRAFESKALYRKNQQFRMFQEVQKSIDVADFLVDITGQIPEIHIDASPKEAGEFTSSFSDSLKGYAVSAGYECALKPNSWAANAVADKYTK